MEPILSTSELGAIRELGESMMTTQITILRKTVITTSSAEYDIYYDYGDDDYTDPEEVEQEEAFETTGWFVSSLQTQFDADIDISTQGLHVVRLAVGTDIRPKDLIRRVDDTEVEYVVIDVNEDDTWPEWIRAMVRRSE